MLVGSMKCDHGQLYTAKIVGVDCEICLNRGMFVIMAVRECDLHTNIETSPQNLNLADLAENELKTAIYR